MTSSTSWKEEDFYVDKEGIPHWDGVDMRHLKQYKARGTIEYEGVIGDGEEAQRKRATLGLRLTRGLTFKAWGAVFLFEMPIHNSMRGQSVKAWVCRLSEGSQWGQG